MNEKDDRRHEEEVLFALGRAHGLLKNTAMTADGRAFASSVIPMLEELLERIQEERRNTSLSEVVDTRERIFDLIRDERLRQEVQWGATHDERHTDLAWSLIIAKHVGRMADYIMDRSTDRRRTPWVQMVKVAAVCVAALEANEWRWEQ